MKINKFAKHIGTGKRDNSLSALVPRLSQNRASYFDGQIWDAHNFATNLFREAKDRVFLIDNYIDNTVFTQLDNREDGVKAFVYTGKINPQMKLDVSLR